MTARNDAISIAVVRWRCERRTDRPRLVIVGFHAASAQSMSAGSAIVIPKERSFLNASEKTKWPSNGFLGLGRRSGLRLRRRYTQAENCQGVGHSARFARYTIAGSVLDRSTLGQRTPTRSVKPSRDGKDALPQRIHPRKGVVRKSIDPFPQAMSPPVIIRRSCRQTVCV